MPRNGPAEIEVIAIRKNSVVALCRRLRQGGLPTPRLNHDILRHSGNKNFVPADHCFAMLRDNLLQALAEVSLQRLVVLQSVRFFELLNLRVGVPLLSVYLVAANVKIVVREKLSHFSHEFIEEFIGRS